MHLSDGKKMANETSALPEEERAAQRLTQQYRFADPDMDLFFLLALGWGPAGGLSVGEAFHVAAEIKDGDGSAWADAFERHGKSQNVQADIWQQRGWARAAGEARLKAFTSYRLAWQFVAPGERFVALYHVHQQLFDQATTELGLTVETFTVPYAGGELPGRFHRGSDHSAPTVLVIGGADTCNEDLFLSPGHYFIERGFSLAVIDLPGQGLVQQQGLYWEVEAERSIAAVIDELIARFAIESRRLVLLGMSLGGYFACRAAAHEPRLAAVIASSPFPRPGELFTSIAREATTEGDRLSDAALRYRQILMWKAGATNVSELLERTGAMTVDPWEVELPFLSIVGGQEGDVFQNQAKEWHAAIRSSIKSFVGLNAETGADAHCQVNNPLRLIQEVDGWVREVLRNS